MTVVALGLLWLAILWSLPLLSDVISLLAGVGAAESTPARQPAGRTRLLLLVPAHDEAHFIGRCIQSLKGQRRERADFDVLVVADNSRDDTARLAMEAGARVIVRRDPAHPGKPAAIAFALQRLPLEEVDAVVIVDADSVVDPGFADALAATGPLRDRAVQGWFGTANPGDSWLTRLASLFEDVRYAGQFRVKQRAGLNVPLTGNGMCIGTGLLERTGWESGGLTEDTELYARLTAAGVPIAFAPQAVVRAHEARDVREGRTQRRRWQAGRWQVLLRFGWPLLSSRAIGPRQKLDALAELCFPGPVVHATLGITLGAPALILGDGLMAAAGGMLLLAPASTVAWTAWALARRPDRVALLLDLLRLPAYAVWRTVTGVAAIASGRSARWERSPRDGG